MIMSSDTPGLWGSIGALSTTGCVCSTVTVRSLESAWSTHDGASLAQLATWLWALCEGQPQRVAVSIEVPRGAIVEGLIERGFHVFAINPKQLVRFRDRHSMAGAKDDRRDAFVLADSLRTDQPRFNRLRLDHPQLIVLREQI